MGNPTKEQVSAAIAVELIKCGALEQKTGLSGMAAAAGVGSKYNAHPEKITPEVAEKIQAVLTKMDPSGPRPGMDAAKAVGIDLTSGQIMSHDIKAIVPAIMKTVGDKSVEEMARTVVIGMEQPKPANVTLQSALKRDTKDLADALTGSGFKPPTTQVASAGTVDLPTCAQVVNGKVADRHQGANSCTR